MISTLCKTFCHMHKWIYRHNTLLFVEAEPKMVISSSSNLWRRCSQEKSSERSRVGHREKVTVILCGDQLSDFAGVLWSTDYTKVNPPLRPFISLCLSIVDQMWPCSIPRDRGSSHSICLAKGNSPEKRKAELLSVSSSSSRKGELGRAATASTTYMLTHTCTHVCKHTHMQARDSRNSHGSGQMVTPSDKPEV